MKPRKIAFIQYGGLATGGTERWLQMMAAHLNPALYQVDYYYCDGPGADAGRRLYLERKGVRLFRFNVGERDLKTPHWTWRDTDFWEIFKEDAYDLIQTAKSRAAEYPFNRMKKPVVEYRTLTGLPDPSPNIACSIHLSQWQRTAWFLRGGDLAKSAVIPIPTELPASTENLRQALQIPADAVVAGFHQRANDAIYSPIPLAAFAQIKTANAYFAIMGGSALYQEQTRRLGITNIRFIEHSSDPVDISRFLNTLDLFAHGRKDGETFGTVFAEALVHGKPCLSHYVEHGANGQEETMGPAGLFAKNENDYAFHLKALYDSSALRSQLAVKARAHAEKYFLIDKAVRHLERIYSAILDRSAPTENTLSYGKSPLGFFYCGPTEKPGDLATHVVTQRIPHAFGLYLARQFKEDISTFVDMGAGASLYGFAMAQENSQSQVYLVEPRAEAALSLNETIWLNNWEPRVRVIASLDPLRADKRSIDFIKMDAQECELETTPLILIQTSAQETPRLERLRKKGYRLWQCTERGYCVEMKTEWPQETGVTVLALHGEKHKRWIERLPAIGRRYRADRNAAKLRQWGWRLLKALRHPARAYAGYARYRQTPSYGWRF